MSLSMSSALCSRQVCELAPLLNTFSLRINRVGHALGNCERITECGSTFYHYYKLSGILQGIRIEILRLLEYWRIGQVQ